MKKYMFEDGQAFRQELDDLVEKWLAKNFENHEDDISSRDEILGDIAVYWIEKTSVKIANKSVTQEDWANSVDCEMDFVSEMFLDKQKDFEKAVISAEGIV